MHIETLDAFDLDALVDLQKRVISSLQEDYFLKHRTIDNWEKMLSCPDYVIYGIFKGEKLIASATIHFPNGTDDRDISEFTPVPDTELAIFQSVMVDENYRGMGLMKILQDARKNSAIKHKRGKIICKMSVNNVNSWKNAINYGFHCVRVAADDTGHDKMYFIKKLQISPGFLAK